MKPTLLAALPVGCGRAGFPDATRHCCRATTMPKLRLSAVPGLLLASLLVLAAQPAGAELERRQVDAILASPPEAAGGFAAFLQALAASGVANGAVTAATAAYLGNNLAADGDDANVLYRLLGIYARLRYGDEALETLARLVAIPTFRQEGVPQHENPAFLRFADTLGEVARDFNLTFRNVDNRVYEITIDSPGEQLVGFHAHADVVPVNPDLWILDDGTRLEPFVLTRVGDRLYGRGAEDDKNGIVVSLYAMRVIKEENLALLRDLRLLVDTTEETVGDAIPYYFERNPTPQYNIALDGAYPVVIAEKGSGTVMASFPVRPGSGAGAEIVSLTGGLATNQIPAASVARLRSDRTTELSAMLNQAGEAYAARHGGDFRISAVPAGDEVVLTVTGVSAHSSEPENGVNPVARMLDFIHEQHGTGLLRANHITDAAHYLSANWGLDYLGNNLGIAYQNDFMGPLTAAPTFVGLDAERLQLAVNLRLPVGPSRASLLGETAARLELWRNSFGYAIEFRISAAEPMYRNPEGAWVNALLDVASENLDLPRAFGSSAGATSIHDLPNGVQFGLAMPQEKYTGHNANEFKRLDQFLLDLQIVTETMARIGRMPTL